MFIWTQILIMRMEHVYLDIDVNDEDEACLPWLDINDEDEACLPEHGNEKIKHKNVGDEDVDSQEDRDKPVIGGTPGQSARPPHSLIIRTCIFSWQWHKTQNCKLCKRYAK